MCGITGVINDKKAEDKVQQSLNTMKNRGSDNTTIITHNNAAFGHNLHAIVGYVPQPFETETHIFAANCEIYNWEELNQKHNLHARNDAEVIFNLIQKEGIQAINQLDGVYAFFLYNKKTNHLTLARDIVGVKPLFYAIQNDSFAFSSEKKTLLHLGFKKTQEVNPRLITTYEKTIQTIKRPFFEITPEHNLTKEELIKQTAKHLEQAILKRVPKDIKLGLLFSGGIDSTIIAYILKKNNVDFTCYTAAVENIGQEASDLIASKKIAEDLHLNLKIATTTLQNLEPYVKDVCRLIESSNVTKVGVALPFHIACEQAQKEGCRVIFSGLGSEEIFAGYERHAVSAGIGKQGLQKSNEYEELDIGNVNKECLSGLTQIHERDLYRDDVITMYNKVELRLPFLDKTLIDFALKIPAKLKITKTEKKIILRDAAEFLNLKSEYARRPKKAAQYGSKFDKALEKLAKQNNFQRKSDYLKQFYKEPNLKLASLLSTGKDSLYASYIMQKRNYELACFLTIKSKNKDSYMFHTPAIELAKLQAKAVPIPLLTKKTKGNKEEELDDLKQLILEAKNKYEIDGVTTGALFSTYQRDRIEKICDELGLICWNPLWHKNQEEYMYELLDNNFEFIIVKVMAEGLTQNHVGKIISKDDVAQLVNLNKTIGINIAGEGGEFETLVLDCPLFKKKLDIKESNFIHDEERFDTVTLDIKDVELVEK